MELNLFPKGSARQPFRMKRYACLFELKSLTCKSTEFKPRPISQHYTENTQHLS